MKNKVANQDKIEALIHTSKLTMSEIANQTGISQSYLARLKNGERKIELMNLTFGIELTSLYDQIHNTN